MAVDALALTVCAWLSTYALHSTVLLGTAWFATRQLRRFERLRDSAGNLREGLWKLALLGGLVSASVQVASGINPWSARLQLSAPNAELLASPLTEQPTPPPTQLAAQPRIAEQPEIAAQPIFAAHPIVTVRALPVFRPAQVAPPASVEPLLPTLLENANAPIEAPATTTLRPSWVDLVLALWLCGVALGALFCAWQWRWLARRLRGRQRISAGPLYERFDALRQRCGARATIGLSTAPELAGPITLGVFRSEICLPPCVEHALQDDELDALFAHELAHAQRRDPAWLALCRALEIVFFFQPLNRIARRRLQDEAEFQCDDWAVVRTGERLPLASCLTEIASWMVHERRELLAPGMVGQPCRLSVRVRRLLDEDHRPERAQRHPWIVGAAGVAAAVIALLVPGVSAHADDGFDDGLLAAEELAFDRDASESEADASDTALEVGDSAADASDEAFKAGEHTAAELACAAARDCERACRDAQLADDAATDETEPVCAAAPLLASAPPASVTGPGAAIASEPAPASPPALFAPGGATLAVPDAFGAAFPRFTGAVGWTDELNTALNGLASEISVLEEQYALLQAEAARRRLTDDLRRRIADFGLQIDALRAERAQLVPLAPSNTLRATFSAPRSTTKLPRMNDRKEQQ